LLLWDGLDRFMTCGYSKMQLTSMATGFHIHLNVLICPITSSLIIMLLICIWLTTNCNRVGKFYLVDLDYPNRPGYLAPYKGTKYHVWEYRQGPAPRGKKELYNYAHSSLRNVIERLFGLLKMKWRFYWTYRVIRCQSKAK